MVNMMRQFLSKKMNLVILQVILYFLIGYALSMWMPWTTSLLIIGLIFCNDRISYILGMTEGMVYATLKKDIFDKWYKLNKDRYENTDKDS